MKKTPFAAFLLGLILFVASNSLAANILDRIDDQQRRIDRGIATKQLTRSEAEVLQENLNWIKIRHARLKADGRLSISEQERLSRMLDNNEQMILDKRRNPIGRVYEPGFQSRISEQQRQIDRGIAAGQLNRREAGVLQENLTWIKARFAKLKADGRLTQPERENLDGLLDANQQMISDRRRHPASHIYGTDFQNRISNQQRQIDRGIAAGQLNRAEAGMLQDNLNWIKIRFARLKADGRMTLQEWEKLDLMLDRNDRMINNNKQNPVGRIYESNIQERIDDQQERIDRGIAAGQLNRTEAGMLQDNLNWIKSRSAKLRADGRFTLDERQKLERMLDQNDQMITDKKRNVIRRVY